MPPVSSKRDADDSADKFDVVIRQGTAGLQIKHSKALNIEVRAVDDPREAVRGADLLSSCTDSMALSATSSALHRQGGLERGCEPQRAMAVELRDEGSSRHRLEYEQFPQI